MWDWFFDGIGTELVSLLIGALTGGFAGYRIGIRHKSKQMQKAESNATQVQVLHADAEIDAKESKKCDLKTTQSQEAGDHATQVQIGGLHDA